MSEAEQVVVVVPEVLLSRFSDLKRNLGGLYVKDTPLTLVEVFEIWQYTLGQHDPTPTTSVEEVKQRIARLESLWRIGRPKGCDSP